MGDHLGSRRIRISVYSISVFSPSGASAKLVHYRGYCNGTREHRMVNPLRTSAWALVLLPVMAHDWCLT